MEDAPTTPTLAPPPILTRTPPTLTPLTCALTPHANTATSSALPPPPPPPPPPQASHPERDGWRSGGGGASRLGLTKEVLSAHTQQEEQAFLDCFKDLSKLRVFEQTSSAVHTPAALSRGSSSSQSNTNTSELCVCGLPVNRQKLAKITELAKVKKKTQLRILANV